MQQQREKQCNKCRLWLPYGNFTNDKSTKDGLYSWCRKCHRQRKAENYSSERQRRSTLLYKYGITPARYNRLFAEQNGVCAICGQVESRINWQTKLLDSLAVDHDHSTGDVRALLCHKCNASLGYMNEDPERIRALLHYAEWCQTREPDTKIIQLPMIEMEDENER
jgi:hypothetical protein